MGLTQIAINYAIAIRQSTTGCPGIPTGNLHLQIRLGEIPVRDQCGVVDLDASSYHHQ